MKKIIKRTTDKAHQMHQLYHLTRPPRLEGTAKEAMMQPVHKKKKKRKIK